MQFSFFFPLLLRPCFIEYKHDKCWNGASWKKKVSSLCFEQTISKKWVNCRISKLFITYCIKYNPYTYCICDISLCSLKIFWTIVWVSQTGGYATTIVWVSQTGGYAITIVWVSQTGGYAITIVWVSQTGGYATTIVWVSQTGGYAITIVWVKQGAMP